MRYTSAITNPIALSSTTTVTILQLETATTNPARIIEYSLSFDGTDSADTPAKVHLVYEGSDSTAAQTVAGSGIDIGFATSLASVRIDSGNTPCSINTYLSSYFLTPIGGLYTEQLPLGREIEVAGGDNFGIQVQVEDTVNCTGYIVWEE